MIDIYIKILLIAIGIAAADRIHLKKNDGIVVGRSFPFKKVYWNHKKYYHLIITGVTGTGKSVLCENIVRGRNRNKKYNLWYKVTNNGSITVIENHYRI